MLTSRTEAVARPELLSNGQARIPAKWPGQNPCLVARPESLPNGQSRNPA